MSSTTRLLVLGVVKLFQPVHGYEVRRELLSWRAQEWASVQPGSIYNALKTLTRDGLLEVASTDQVGGRPERTTYRLTRAGEEEFHTLLREEWWTVRPPVDPLMAAMSFLTEMPRAEAIAALEHRIAQIHGMGRHLEFAIEAHDGKESPYHVREMMRLMNARITAEIAWSQQFLGRLRNHEYSTADDPPWLPASKAAAAGPSAGPTGRPDAAPARRRSTPPRRAELTTDRDRNAGAVAARKKPRPDRSPATAFIRKKPRPDRSPATAFIREKPRPDRSPAAAFIREKPRPDRSPAAAFIREKPRPDRGRGGRGTPRDPQDPRPAAGRDRRGDVRVATGEPRYARPVADVARNRDAPYVRGKSSRRPRSRRRRRDAVR
jgi:DNA-binding PadR family transcriptional regulator